MIKANFNTYGSYVTDSLYQWDLNQVLSVTGLNLSVAPEVHFSNCNMDKVIVRQSTLNSGVVSVAIPNSLLQEPFTIEAHIGVYEGDTFKVIELVSIPIISKKRPNDYQIQNSDEEIYSFKALENLIANMVKRSDYDRNNTVVNARIDNIIAHNNDTDGNTELIDIRTDNEGKIHASAGEAVRTQFQKLSDKIKSSFVETGWADKYISACKIFTDEYECLMISDIRRKYVANNDGGKTSIRIYSCDETGKSYTQVATIELPLDFEKGNIEHYFGQNSLLRCYVDLTSLNVGERLTGDGKPFVVKRECILPRSFDIDIERLKTALFSSCNTEPKKILTWVDDDTLSNGIESVKTICDSLGIKCTFATITQNWNESLIEKLHQFQKEGFHITCHTENHGRWYKDMDDGIMFNAQEMETDLLISLEKMRNEGFVDSDMLVYPGGSPGRTDVNTIGIVKKWCRCGVLAGGTTWGKYGQGKYKINRTFVNKSSYDSSYYKNLLDSVSDESWVVLGSHSGSTNEFDSNMMTEILSYALEKGWVIMTLNEALKYREKYYHIQEMLGL